MAGERQQSELAGHGSIPEELLTQGGPTVELQDPLAHDSLREQNALLDAEVKAALAAKIEQIGGEALPRPEDYFAIRLNAAVAGHIDRVGYDSALTSIAPPTQKNAATADATLAFNAAGIAKAAGESPLAVAELLKASLEAEPVVGEVATAGPFVNIGLDYSVAAVEILDEVSTLGSRYGHYREGEPQVVIIDYSSPNVAKNMTVAHLRSTIIGHTLMKIQQAAGNIPFGVNHIGDWGTQFGNIIYQYNHELATKGDAFIEELNADPTATLMRIYRTFNETKDDNPEAVQSAREIFHRLETGDPELVELWDRFRAWSLRDFGPSYDRLRIEFDAIQGESFYEDRMTPAVNDAVEKGVLVPNEDGSIVFPAQALTNPTTGQVNERVMLDPDGNPRDEIILKPNGGTVYLTRDLAAIRYRGQELGADKVLYVIGKEQQAHCLQLFAMASKLGYMALGSAEHISFGHLNVDGRKMKSRSGRVVLLNDILDESVAAAASMLQERKVERGESPELTEEEQEVARKVGISAVIFNDLKQDRQKDIEFSPDAAKTVEAGGVTYIQYTDSRLNSILDKNQDAEPFSVVPENLAPEEKALLAEIARLPLVVGSAAELNSPHKLATYLTDFCRSLNAFYREHPVTKAATTEQRAFRVALVRAAKQVIENTSDLLHIELPGRM